jgi:hypothetical protein
MSLVFAPQLSPLLHGFMARAGTHQIRGQILERRRLDKATDANFVLRIADCL